MTDYPRVSDHALLRWLERIEGVDIDGLRSRLSHAAAVGIAHGAPSVLLGSGRLLLRDRTVTTVLHKKQIPATDAYFIRSRGDDE